MRDFEALRIVNQGVHHRVYAISRRRVGAERIERQGESEQQGLKILGSHKAILHTAL